jgi:prepilin-type processing-associated H-X9-DG protein
MCPANLSLSGPPNGKAGLPRIRSISMNQMFRTWPEGHSPASPLGVWRIYGKTSDLTAPSPANLWVVIDENPDSVNDAAYAVKMDYQGTRALWQDGPATYHGGGCGFSFADGHSEIRKWKDGRTLRPPMLATYTREFPFGQLHRDSQDIAWVQERTSAKAR